MRQQHVHELVKEGNARVILVLTSPELDFERESSGKLTYLGPCIHTARDGRDFPWALVPRDADLIYCTLGTQSLRDPRAASALEAIVQAFAGRDDCFFVVACPKAYAERLAADPCRVLLVSEAPQLALLRRATLAIHHGGFNTLKECAFFGVPQVALPLSHDQFRNATLVVHRGLGMSITDTVIDPKQLLDTACMVKHSEVIRASLRRNALRARAGKSTRRPACHRRQPARESRAQSRRAQSSCNGGAARS